MVDNLIQAKLQDASFDNVMLFKIFDAFLLVHHKKDINPKAINEIIIPDSVVLGWCPFTSCTTEPKRVVAPKKINSIPIAIVPTRSRNNVKLFGCPV